MKDRPNSEISRRKFIATAGAVALATALTPALGHSAEKLYTIPLPTLPYPENALEPVISANTIGFHYGRHHRGYLENLNRLVAGTKFEGMPLEKIVMETSGKKDSASIFNNAAQVWNHNFYWKSLKPRGGGDPSGKIKELIQSSFGSLDAFRKEFADIAISQFGSGWGWLVKDGDKLKVVKTGNAETPITQNIQPLLVIDVWEHAYYLDYQNRRADYANAVIGKLLDWDFASENAA